MAKTTGEHIVPILRLEYVEGRGNKILGFYGTGFFLNSAGLLMTAAHVLRNAYADADKKGGRVVVAYTMREQPNVGRAGEIKRWEVAPDPFDVAIAQTGAASVGAFVPVTSHSKVWMWEEVATVGYPESAAMRFAEDASMYPPRAYQGYITRVVPERSLGFPHGKVFELNFPVVQGMSGAPLVQRNIGLSFVLLGVCIGSHASEVEMFQHEEIEESGQVFREKRVRVEHYGLAQDIRPLLTWEPQGLEGRTIGSVIESAF